MTHQHSRYRLLGHDLAELPADINGMPDGPGYAPFLTIDEMRAWRSLQGGINGIWSGRNHQLASKSEIDSFVILEGNHNVVSIREGYPFYSPEVLEDLRQSKPVSRNRVITIDFVLTLRPRNFGGPMRYKGLSSKPESLKKLPAQKMRSIRERERLATIGWEWGYLTTPPAQAVFNHRVLRSWAKAYPLDEAATDAAQLAALFYRSTSAKPLERQLAMFGKRLGIAPDDQFFVFAGAYYLGYLAVEHVYKLDAQLPPVLRPPPRSYHGSSVHGR